ncbi:unnamed protein product [Discosporangium mesarthrocarpum]
MQRIYHGLLTLLGTVGLGRCDSSQLVADIVDSITPSQLTAAGGCVDGCVHQVVKSVVKVSGEPLDCQLRTHNLTTEVVEGGAVQVIHHCISNGKLETQGIGSCNYDVCADFSWVNGRVSYEVIVSHPAPVAEHEVHVQVYLNSEYFTGEINSTTAGNGCEAQGVCSGLQLSKCGSEESEITLEISDSAGDGWIGGLEGRENTWVLEKIDDSGVPVSTVAQGTLTQDHFQEEQRLCLENGSYTFTSSWSGAWFDDIAWSVCGVAGGGGESVEINVADGVCSRASSVKARAIVTPPPDQSQGVCTQPEGSPCAQVLIDGVTSSVAMFYDEQCTDYGAVGCGGLPGSGPWLASCRLCFVDKVMWEEDFPGQRVPDWVDCPCCVANLMGFPCEGGEDVPQGSSEGWVSDTALAVYLGGTVMMSLVVIGCCLGSVKYFESLKRKSAKAQARARVRVRESVEGAEGAAEGNGHSSHGTQPAGGAGAFSSPERVETTNPYRAAAASGADAVRTTSTSKEAARREVWGDPEEVGAPIDVSHAAREISNRAQQGRAFMNIYKDMDGNGAFQVLRPHGSQALGMCGGDRPPELHDVHSLTHAWVRNQPIAFSPPRSDDSRLPGSRQTTLPGKFSGNLSGGPAPWSLPRGEASGRHSSALMSGKPSQRPSSADAIESLAELRLPASNMEAHPRPTSWRDASPNPLGSNARRTPTLASFRRQCSSLSSSGSERYHCFTPSYLRQDSGDSATFG